MLFGNAEEGGETILLDDGQEFLYHTLDYLISLTIIFVFHVQSKEFMNFYRLEQQIKIISMCLSEADNNQ